MEKKQKQKNKYCDGCVLSVFAITLYCDNYVSERPLLKSKLSIPSFVYCALFFSSFLRPNKKNETKNKIRNINCKIARLLPATFLHCTIGECKMREMRVHLPKSMKMQMLSSMLHASEIRKRMQKVCGEKCTRQTNRVVYSCARFYFQQHTLCGVHKTMKNLGSSQA